jgi:carbamoyltransferase
VAARFFDVSPRSASYPERFMLSVVNVCEEWRGRLPGITHVDGTARVQAVHRDTEPGYCRLIEMFGQATGVPVLLNTSFNLRAEPIVNTPGEAFSTFMKSGMDALVLGDCLVEKDASLA